MHHQQPGDSARREYHDGDEDQPEIEQPHRRQIAEAQRQQRDEDRADDRADEKADATDIGRVQHGCRLQGPEIGRVGDLEIDRR